MGLSSQGTVGERKLVKGGPDGATAADPKPRAGSVPVRCRSCGARWPYVIGYYAGFCGCCVYNLKSGNFDYPDPTAPPPPSVPRVLAQVVQTRPRRKTRQRR